MKTKGRLIQSDLPSIFKAAFSKVANIQKAISGFEKTEIYPLNPDTFSDDDFVAATLLLGSVRGESAENSPTSGGNNEKQKKQIHQQT